MTVKTILNRETLVPVGAIALAVSLVITIASYLHRVEMHLANIDRSLASIWSRQEQVQWAYELKVANPSLHVPIPPLAAERIAPSPTPSN